MFGRSLSVALAATALAASAAYAHHGWAWAEEAVSTLSGTVEGEVYVGNPHATMNVRAESGVWFVELAPPAGTMAAGFVDGVVRAGDQVTIWGHRALDPAERHLKGIRVEHNGQFYDVYPDRVREDLLPLTAPVPAL
ncbi:MAG: hypothetical protein IT535_07180 [Bauldia sp.]|nr:hypothetical protein [Bauldia sp.]